MHPMRSQFISLWGDHVNLGCFCRTLARTLIFFFLFLFRFAFTFTFPSKRSAASG